jgi:hypothetical protein
MAAVTAAAATTVADGITDAGKRERRRNSGVWGPCFSVFEDRRVKLFSPGLNFLRQFFCGGDLIRGH